MDHNDIISAMAAFLAGISAWIANKAEKRAKAVEDGSRADRTAMNDIRRQLLLRSLLHAVSGARVELTALANLATQLSTVQNLVGPKDLRLPSAQRLFELEPDLYMLDVDDAHRFGRVIECARQYDLFAERIAAFEGTRLPHNYHGVDTALAPFIAQTHVAIDDALDRYKPGPHAGRAL